MPKTKTKTKKPIMTMTVELPKTIPPTATESVKLALDALEASTGWGIIRRILDENIKFLETCILTKTDPITKQPISDTEAEICRQKRNLNIELRDTPKNYRQQVDDTGIVPKDFDPYFKTRAELEKAEMQERG